MLMSKWAYSILSTLLYMYMVALRVC